MKQRTLCYHALGCIASPRGHTAAWTLNAYICASRWLTPMRLPTPPASSTKLTAPSGTDSDCQQCRTGYVLRMWPSTPWLCNMLACHAPSLEQTAIGKRSAKLHAACVLVRRLAAVCAPLETLVSATVQHSRLGRHDRGSDAMLHGGDYAQALMTGFGNHLRSSDVSDEAVFCKTGFETGRRVSCYRPALPHSWCPRHTPGGSATPCTSCSI